MGASTRAVILFAMLGSPSAVLAGDCLIENAIYREAETGVELSFAAASGENTPLTHGFSTSIAGTKLDGHVMFDPEIERSVGMLMNNCPEGDVTGSDLAACTIWKGIPYGIDEATGHVDLLPSEGAKAPDALLLPGFGPAVAQSKMGAAISTVPWDLFELKGCAS